MSRRRPRIPRRSFLGLSAAAGLGLACVEGVASGDGSLTVDDGVVRRRLTYGDHADAFGELWTPVGAGAALPIVVLVHGGFWRSRFRLDLMDGLARSLVDAGYAAWNVEYRRVGSGGGYPETFDDVAAAVDHLANVQGSGAVGGTDPEDLAPRLDLTRVAVVGHSAGGHLAAWIASRSVLPPGVPGADPVVRPIVAFPLAGVLDLAACAREQVGGAACPDLLGGTPGDVPERYAAASPAELVPIGVPVIALHGDRDASVPVTQSARYVDAARSVGDPADLVLVEGGDHFDVIDPDHEAWRAVLERLPSHLS